MEIRPLQDAPGAIPEVARWHHAEWQALYPHKSCADFEDDLRRPPGPDGLPQTWLLLDGDAVVGSASLLASDLDSRPDLTPWLANIYVRPERRGEGLGQRLVNSVMQEGRRRGITTLYLFTGDQQAFYERLGWSLLAVEPCAGTPVAIMSCPLAPGGAPARPGS